MTDQHKTTPPEAAIKRAISALNMEASRLRIKADAWDRDHGAPLTAAQAMRADADELQAVRNYLEQFVTRETPHV